MQGHANINRDKLLIFLILIVWKWRLSWLFEVEYNPIIKSILGQIKKNTFVSGFPTDPNFYPRP